MDSKHAALKRYCLTLTKSAWDADDLAQDTWEKIIDHVQHVGNPPKPLLRRISKNRWIDIKRRDAVFDKIVRQQKPSELLMPDEGTFGIETVFQSLLQHMSPLQRAVFLLRDVFGYTAREAADRLGMTEGAVKAGLHRARQALRRVRKDLETGGLPLAREEGVKALLHALAQSYLSGDIATLVELVQQDELDGATVIGCMTTNSLKFRKTVAPGGTSPEMRMAAA